MKSFDKSIYFLGSLCKRGHNYEGTGKSLRYLKGTHACVPCVYAWSLKNYDRKKRREYYVRTKKHRAAWIRSDRKKKLEQYKAIALKSREKHREQRSLAERIRFKKLTPKQLERRRKAERKRLQRPEVKAAEKKRVRRQNLKRQKWPIEIAYAKNKAEPERAELLELLEKTIAIHACFLDMRAEVIGLNKR